MAHQVSVKYIGDLRTESKHIDSNSLIITDAPKDNEGLGSKFSPTDLVASSLGSCLLTIMGIVSRRHNIELNGSYANISKIMGENPRRIKEINVGIHINNIVKDSEIKILKKAALHCPVHNSLNKEININITFNR